MPKKSTWVGLGPAGWGSAPRERMGLARVDLAGYTRLMAIRPELRDALLKLPADERQELADKLYESLDDEQVDPAWERAWSDEIARRVQEIADDAGFFGQDVRHGCLRHDDWNPLLEIWAA